MAIADRASPPVRGFLDGLNGAFRRRDQAYWAALYLEGLLRPGGRKTVEHMVRTLAPSAAAAGRNPAQALHHFLNHSPWDEDRLWHRCRELLTPHRAADGLLVATELAFVKQGRHSVGVQRQYSSALGRKTNCQVAVAVFHAGPVTAFPLALRLYLPRGWQQDPARLDAAGVPPAGRPPLTRTDLAIQMLDDVAGEPPPERILTCTAGWTGQDDLARAADRRGLSFTAEVPAGVDQAVRDGVARLQELGLDHFEGRSWRGFHHHACLVVLAQVCQLLHSDAMGGRETASERGGCRKTRRAPADSGAEAPSPADARCVEEE